MNETPLQAATPLTCVRFLTRHGCLEHNLANLGLIMIMFLH